MQSWAQNHVSATSPIWGMRDRPGLQFSLLGAWGWCGDGDGASVLPAAWGILFKNASLIHSDTTHRQAWESVFLPRC